MLDSKNKNICLDERSLILDCVWKDEKGQLQNTRNEQSEEKAVTKVGLFRVVFATIVAGIGSLIVGLDRAYPSPAIPDLNANPNPFHVSGEEQSWIVSLGFLSSLVGSMVAAGIVDRCGRKTTLMLAAVPSAIGWSITIASQNGVTLAIGRMITGVTNPIYNIVAVMYVAEIAPVHIRGLLVSTMKVLYNVGSLMVYVAGAYIHWNWLAVLCLAPSVLLTALMASLPETPRWLLMKHREAEAWEALAWLRGTTTDAAIEEAKQIQVGLSTSNGSNKDVIPWSSYFRHPFAKYLAISQGLVLIGSMSGAVVVRTYTVTIFQAAGSDINPFTQTIIVGVTLVVGSVSCSLVVERFSRRTLLMTSTGLMALGWTAIGTYFFVLKSEGTTHAQPMFWLPLTSMIVVAFGSCLGVVLFPNLITNEMFPTKARGRATSMVELTFSLGRFVILKCFLSVTLLFGIQGPFYFCAGVCALGVLFTYFCVPETKGKSLEELQKQFLK